MTSNLIIQVNLLHIVNIEEEINHMDTNDNKLKQEAERSVTQQNGKWVLNFQRPIQGIDLSKTYTSKELAIEAAVHALKKQDKVA